MKEHRTILAGGALALLALPLQAQLDICYVTDTSNDNVVLCQDLDGNGDYNGAGETSVYYDDTIGTIALSNNVAITLDDMGIAYIADGSTDEIMACVDLDGDGECNDVGEHWIFFDGNPGGNLSGVEMAAVGGIYLTPDGKLWVASANNSGGGMDIIFYLEDLDGDGNANGAGEAFIYYDVPNAGSVGDTIPYDVQMGPDGAMYYLETGSTGMYSKGIYRLEDTNGNGFIDPGTAESSLFYEPAAMANTPFFWAFNFAGDGFFYMADSGNELVWKFSDTSGDNFVTPGTEDVQYWTSAGSSLIWSVYGPEDGSLYCNESQSPDRMLRFVDVDGSGVIDQSNEYAEIYDETFGAVNIGNPRGLYVYVSDEFGTAVCFGDGSGATACPCGNTGAAGEGCKNSTGVGATLLNDGSPSVSADDLTFAAAGLIPTQSALLFVGKSLVNGGDGITWGDGLRCAGGGITRLGVQAADVAGDAMWGPGLHGTYGAWGVGQTVVFQVWYRDPGASPCASEQNTTHALEFVTEP